MTTNATCPQCGRSVQVDLGDVDGVLADALARFASHAVCDACAGPEHRTKPAERKRPEAPQRTIRQPYRDD